MTTKPVDATPTETELSLPSNLIFELLLDDQRRYALYYLSRNVEAVSLEVLIDRIADREGVDNDGIDCIAIEFHHNHLRKLIDSDVLQYDSDAETVERRTAARSLDPYLELAYADEP
ncbi:DUF7344 domain-containing protein [Natrinema altunense]|uniref:DUF7344 domain-containing protein n=2 Tax=Natrinema altunense TaxID=222984 RepID=L9ZC98_NATA2|nr:hypothetical protein [Natrinema altunense]ELY84085.1 hypothetical protein C485_16600 [Natrinema altunense JCM 12890]RZH68132.1 hypothetical protein ELS17_01285 [Natrinema altunense]